MDDEFDTCGDKFDKFCMGLNEREMFVSHHRVYSFSEL